jgi:hypothetical protein
MKAGISLRGCRHILLQFNPAFGQHPTLTFMLFNTIQRHQLARGLATAVKNNDESFTNFKTLVSDPNIMLRIESAMKNPLEPESVKLVRQIETTLKLTGKHLAGSNAARSGAQADFMATQRFFGNASQFNTFAPAPTSNLSATRTTFSSRSNKGFPAQDGGFAASVRRGATMIIDGVSCVLSKTEITKRATEHAAAAAEAHGNDIRFAYLKLYCVPLTEDLKKTTAVLQSRDNVGIVGRAVAASGVSETNGKGFVHNHHLVNGFSSTVQQAITGAVGDETNEREVLAMQVAFGKFRGKCSTASLPPEIHVQSLITGLCGFSCFECQWYTDRARTSASFETQVSATIPRVGLHTSHSSTCHKGKMGKTFCSMCFGQPCLGTCGAFGECEPSIFQPPQQLLLDGTFADKVAPLVFDKGPCVFSNLPLCVYLPSHSVPCAS